MDYGYIGNPDRLTIIPESVPFLRKARDLGFILIVVTNQSGIARGYFTQEDYNAVKDKLSSMFSTYGIDFAAIYHCPHHPEGIGELGIRCDCRKPLPGMILKAAQEHNVDLAHSVMVGDKQSDIQAAQAAKVGFNFLVRSTQSRPHKDDDGIFRCVMSQLDDIAACPLKP